MKTSILSLVLTTSFLSTFVLAMGMKETQTYSDQVRQIKLSAGSTNWEFFSGDDIASGEKHETELLFVARGPEEQNNMQSTLSWRVDKPEKKSEKLNVKAYTEKWLKEYSKFGYEVGLSQPATYGSMSGFEVEITSQVNDKRVRQFIVAQEHEYWIFSCSAQKSLFRKSWEDCAKILSSSKKT
jgi:hypothetical protein